MYFRALFYIAGLLLIDGCASYKPTATPIVQLNDSDLLFSKDGYGAKVDPYLDQDRQKSYFNADFNKAGFLAVNVMLKNKGKDPAEVRPYDIYLVFPGGSQMAPIDGQVVATQIEENGSVVGSVLAFGLVGGLVATQAEHDAKNARIADYTSKQLKETALAPGESAHGFLFYRWTPSPSAQAEFEVELYDKTNDQLSIVMVPFGSTKAFAANPSATASQSPSPAQIVPPSAALAPSTGPIDVPVTIDLEEQSYEGVARLENGHLSGQILFGNKSFFIAGEIRKNELSIGVSGAFGRMGTWDAPGNSQCSADGSSHPASGEVAIPMRAACGGQMVHVTLHLSLPPAGVG